MTEKVFFSAIAASAFGILFNVRGRDLLLTGLNGGLGYFIYIFSTGRNIESYVGMFFASLSMSVIAEIIARIRKAPTSVFLAPALIPIVPGGGMFRCALNLLEGEIEPAVTVGINTVLEAGAIAVGIIVISSVMKVTSHKMYQKTYQQK